MAIERPMGQNPFIQEGADPAMEIDIVNPESVSVETPDGGVIIDFDPSAGMVSADHNANLADEIDDSDLRGIASELVSAYEADRDSRGDWEETYIKGLDLLGLKNEDRTQPWDGACGVFHPVLTEAVVRFQAQSIQEIFPASGPVKTAVVGAITSDKEQQAERVRDYLNYLPYGKRYKQQRHDICFYCCWISTFRCYV